jgi:hypothetical protein
MNPDPSSLPEASSFPESERRLWFDYISKLNDRRLQETGASGATSWVLLGVEAAILYRCVPRFGGFLATPGALRSAAVLFALEVDLVLACLSAISTIGKYGYFHVAGKKRLLPKMSERFGVIVGWFIFGLVGGLSALHLVLAVALGHVAFVKWTLVSCGIFWMLTALAKIVKDLPLILKKRRLGVVVPELSFLQTPETLGALLAGFCVTAALFVASASALIVYMSYLRGSLPGRLIPLSAATYSFVFMAVGLTLLARLLGDSSKMAYYELERSILIENLSAPEIKARFITQLLGQDLGDWVNSFTEKLEAEVLSVRAAIDSIDRRAREVEAIDAALAYERLGRASKLGHELTAVLKGFDSALNTFTLSLDEYLKIPVSGEELEFRDRTMAGLKSRIYGLKAHSASAKALSSRLSRMICEEGSSAK